MVENQAEKNAKDERRFVENMRRLREERDWTQTELARRMVGAGWENYTQMTVSRTEKFERPLRLSESRTLAAILGSTLEEMILPGLDLGTLDHLKETVDSTLSAHSLLRTAVKNFMLTRGNLQLMLNLSSRMETRTWDNDAAVKRLREMEKIGKELASITLQTAIDEALDQWRKDGQVD